MGLLSLLPLLVLSAIAPSHSVERTLLQAPVTTAATNYLPANITVSSDPYDFIATPITPNAPYSQAAFQCNVSGDSRIPGYSTFPLTLSVPVGKRVRVIFANGNLNGAAVTAQGEPGVIVQQGGAVIVQQAGYASPIVQPVGSPIVQSTAPPPAQVYQSPPTTYTVPTPPPAPQVPPAPTPPTPTPPTPTPPTPTPPTPTPPTPTPPTPTPPTPTPPSPAPPTPAPPVPPPPGTCCQPECCGETVHVNGKDYCKWYSEEKDGCQDFHDCDKCDVTVPPAPQPPSPSPVPPPPGTCCQPECCGETVHVNGKDYCKWYSEEKDGCKDFHDCDKCDVTVPPAPQPPSPSPVPPPPGTCCQPKCCKDTDHDSAGNEYCKRYSKNQDRSCKDFTDCDTCNVNPPTPPTPPGGGETCCQDKCCDWHQGGKCMKYSRNNNGCGSCNDDCGTCPVGDTPTSPTPASPTPTSPTPASPARISSTPTSPTPTSPTPTSPTPTSPTPTSPTPTSPTPTSPTPTSPTPTSPTPTSPMPTTTPATGRRRMLQETGTSSSSATSNGEINFGDINILTPPGSDSDSVPSITGSGSSGSGSGSGASSDATSNGAINLGDINLLGRRLLQETVPGGPNNGLVEYVALASNNTVPGFVVPNTQFGVPYIELTATAAAKGQVATFRGVLKVAQVNGGVPQIPFVPNPRLSPDCQVNVNLIAV